MSSVPDQLRLLTLTVEGLSAEVQRQGAELTRLRDLVESSPGQASEASFSLVQPPVLSLRASPDSGTPRAPSASYSVSSESAPGPPCRSPASQSASAGVKTKVSLGIPFSAVSLLLGRQSLLVKRRGYNWR